MPASRRRHEAAPAQPIPAIGTGLGRKSFAEQGTDIGHFVNEKVQSIAGIRDTRTIITFKAFSRVGGGAWWCLL
jgi:hypothetical protein